MFSSEITLTAANDTADTVQEGHRFHRKGLGRRRWGFSM